MAVRMQTMTACLAVSLFALFACLPDPCASCASMQPVDSRGGQCENISTNIDCGDLYEASFFPNNIAANSQQAVGFVVAYLFSGPNTPRNCSRYMRLHVCLAVLPVCEATDNAGTLRVRPPCRDLCREVEADCSSDLQTFQDTSCLLNCDQWPETDCVGLEDPIVIENVSPEPTKPDTTPTRPIPTPTATVTPFRVNETKSSCPLESQTYFSDEAKTFAKGWVVFWSVLCFLSTLVTLLTFLLDMSRFQYPWRPVIYLALSFHIHTLGYFLAFIVGPRSVTCPGGSYVETDSKWTWAHTPCILVFGLLYYSMVAAFLWWFILTLCWFLSSAYKWTNEAISQFALFYHTAAWVLPLILTISVLAARVVSADELTGTCFIVRTEAQTSFLALLLAVILPLSIFLLIGSLFLIIGFVSLLQIRRFMVHRGKERESIILEKLMIRIGVYVAIYVLPAAVLIAGFVYEIDTRPRWHTVSDTCDDCSRPNTAVFMVRVFMFLLIGVLTGVWIWSKKTLQSWKKLPVKLRHCVFPVAERTQDAATSRTATRLNSFTNPPHPHVSGPSPSYPYAMDSGGEFSA